MHCCLCNAVIQVEIPSTRRRAFEVAEDLLGSKQDWRERMNNNFESCTVKYLEGDLVFCRKKSQPRCKDPPLTTAWSSSEGRQVTKSPETLRLSAPFYRPPFILLSIIASCYGCSRVGSRKYDSRHRGYSCFDAPLCMGDIVLAKPRCRVSPWLILAAIAVVGRLSQEAR